MPLVPCHLDLSISSYGLWLKRYFCWLLNLTYNVEIDNFLWVHCLDMEYEDWLMNYEKVMPWSRYNWLFYCPKIVTFCILMIFEPCLWNHDQDLIKWWLWTQKRCWPKILTFDYKMTILPLQLIVGQMRLLTVQIGTVSLETWHVGAWDCI